MYNEDIEKCYKDILGQNFLINIDHKKVYEIKNNDNTKDLVYLKRIETNNTPIFYSILNLCTYKLNDFEKVIEENRFKETDYRIDYRFKGTDFN